MTPHIQKHVTIKNTEGIFTGKIKKCAKSRLQLDEEMKENFPPKPTSNEVMEELNYCRQVVEIVETQSKVAQIPAVKEKLNVLKEVVKDYDLQLSYSPDPDAPVGHKSAESAFFGFKTHIAMSDERII